MFEWQTFPTFVVWTRNTCTDHLKTFGAWHKNLSRDVPLTRHERKKTVECRSRHQPPRSGVPSFNGGVWTLGEHPSTGADATGLRPGPPHGTHRDDRSAAATRSGSAKDHDAFAKGSGAWIDLAPNRPSGVQIRRSTHGQAELLAADLAPNKCIILQCMYIIRIYCIDICSYMSCVTRSHYVQRGSMQRR